jgi:hypothetical protein
VHAVRNPMNRGYHKGMKRAWIMIALVAVLALQAFGQINGVPASVTSMAPWRSINPGPPASVTSLGPRGYWSPCATGLSALAACGSTHFSSAHNFPGGRDRGPANLDGNRHHRGFVPVYVPYYYPVVVAAEPEPQPVEVVEEEDDRPAPTVFERRRTSERVPRAPVSRLGPEPEDPPVATTREPEVKESPPAQARAQIPTVLVYRDGHQQEVSNYAIVGQTLYDLGAFVAHKIPLAELNLRATMKANDDRGIEFAVPASVKLD